MLKKFIFALSLSTALSFPVIAQAAGVSDSVAQALSSHPQMKAGEASRAGADRNVWEQRSGFFPMVGVSGETGRLHIDDKTTRANTASQGGYASWMGDGKITITQPIFDGFGTMNRFRGAEDRYSAASYDLNGTAEDVAIRAVRAHLNLMRTKELLTLASKFLSDIQVRRKNIALMVKGGAADEAELLQADEIQTAAQNAKLGYEDSFRQAEADYIEVSGGMPDAVLEVGEETWNTFIPATLEDALARGAKENPHILAADKMTNSMAKELDAEKASLAPHLDAEVSYMKQDQLDIVGGESTDARAMLKLAWNFSTGGGQFARIEKSQQQHIESFAKKQSVMRQVERDVRQKYSSMQIVDKQLPLLTDKAGASRRILENFTAQFEGGKQSNLQLIAANSKLFDAQTSLTDVRYRQLLTRFELLNAIGVLRNALGVAKAGVSQKG